MIWIQHLRGSIRRWGKLESMEGSMSKKIKYILEQIKSFRDERDWMQFHDPKNMAISIAIEASELLQEFQWKNKKDVEEHIKQNIERVQDEIADVALYLFELADNLNIDLIEAMSIKLEKNKEKYPVEKAKGIAKKYTEL